MNKVILMGRLTADPEVKYSQGAEPLTITRYTLAVRKQFKREGEVDADFINCTALGGRGDFASKYFKKGQMVAVCGRLSIREYDDKSGNRQRFTEVVIDDQYFTGAKSASSASDASDDLDWITENTSSKEKR